MQQPNKACSSSRIANGNAVVYHIKWSVQNTACCNQSDSSTIVNMTSILYAGSNLQKRFVSSTKLFPVTRLSLFVSLYCSLVSMFFSTFFFYSRAATMDDLSSFRFDKFRGDLVYVRQRRVRYCSSFIICQTVYLMLAR